MFGRFLFATGGKSFLVFAAGFGMYLASRVDAAMFMDLTMAFLIGQGTMDGMATPDEKAPTGIGKLWAGLGGRKFLAWVAVTALLAFKKGYPQEDWGLISAVYIGAIVIENAIPKVTVAFKRIGR